MNDIKIGDGCSNQKNDLNFYDESKEWTSKLIDMLIGIDLSTGDDLLSIYNEIKTNYLNKRLIYSIISNKIYDLDEDILNNLEMACERLVEYSATMTSDNDNESIKKIITKLADHINLALAQERYLISYNNNELQDKIDNVDAFMENVEEIKNRIENINTQIISVLGIFTAIAFILFGGISSAASIFDKMNNPSIGQLLIFGGIWGLIMYNTIYFLIYYVSKLTKVSIKTNNRYNASIYRRHPYVCIINYVFISLTIIGLWLYLVEFTTGNQWMTLLVENNKDLLMFGTMIIIIILIGFLLWLIHKVTDESKDWG